MKKTPSLPAASALDWENLCQYTREAFYRPLRELLRDEERTAALNLKAAGIYFDFSRTHLSKPVLDRLESFAAGAGLMQWRDALREGQVVNPTEGQSALHHCYRLPEAQLSDWARRREELASIQTAREKCARVVEQIRTGQLKSAAGKPYKYLLHLGIGGSALGPKLVLESLSYGIDTPYKVHFVANIDGHCLEPVLRACNPEETLVIVCSKTFTTLETLRNAGEAIEWLQAAGISTPLEQFIAVTARPERAVEFGIDESRVLFFPKSIGGRYSVWSAVGLPAMVVLGQEVFRQFLAGAHEMDEHFFNTELRRNAPALAGLIDIWYRNCHNLQTVAIFCYDQRLELLIPYCQQLYMESNGKDRNRNGEPLGHPSAPVLWGGVGTEAQHAVFQLMHQGTGVHLPDFIAVARAAHAMPVQHQHLLANLLAQSSALSAGRNRIDGRVGRELNFVESSRLFSGNRPSTVIVLPELNARTLGALLAYYEHRTFVSGILWGINVYDQMGVELGKEMAQSLFAQLSRTELGASADPGLRHLLRILQQEG